MKSAGIAKALESEVQQAAEQSIKPRAKKEEEAGSTLMPGSSTVMKNWLPKDEN